MKAFWIRPLLASMVWMISFAALSQDNVVKEEPAADPMAETPVNVNPWVFSPSSSLVPERAIPEISGGDPIIQEKDIEETHAYASNHHLGIVLGYSNTGVAKGMYKSSQDTLLLGKVSESVWGLGLLVDLGWSEDALSSLRSRWSWGRGRVNIPENIRDQNPPDSLEESLNLFLLDFVMRAGFKQVDMGYPIWIGGGFSIHYAMASSTGGSGSGRLSQLKNSTSISPLLAIGSDISIEEGHQLVLEADWLVFKGLKFNIGLRTRL